MKKLKSNLLEIKYWLKLIIGTKDMQLLEEYPKVAYRIQRCKYNNATKN